MLFSMTERTPNHTPPITMSAYSVKWILTTAGVAIYALTFVHWQIVQASREKARIEPALGKPKLTARKTKKWALSIR